MPNERILVGIDEVGRGCLAGPVWACAYAFRPGMQGGQGVKGVRDSKKLSPKKRESLQEPLMKAGWHGHGWMSPAQIDSVGIGPATFLAMHAALLAFQQDSQLAWSQMSVVIDGNVLPRAPEWAALGLGQLSCLIKADDLVPAVSAASVLAKVERDALMARLSLSHPGYGFEGNVGYGSADHMSAIAERGPSAVHRMSFAPMKNMMPEPSQRPASRTGRRPGP